MSARVLAVICDDPDAARRVAASVLAKVEPNSRGVWREERAGAWWVAFWREAPFPSFVQARRFFEGPLRALFSEAVRGESTLTLLLVAWEDQQMTRQGYCVSPARPTFDVKRSIDARGRCERVWLDNGRRKRATATEPVDETPYCALAWLEAVTGIVREALVEAAYRVSADSPAVGGDVSAAEVAALEVALRDPSPSVRSQAIHQIAERPDGARFVEALRAALDDPERHVATQAADALGKLDPDLEALAARGRRALLDPSRRGLAIRLLRASRSAIELAGCLEEPALADAAAIALATMEPLPDAILPALLSAMARDDASQTYLVSAIGNVRGAPDRVLPVLVAQAGDRKLASAAIGAIAALDATLDARRAALWPLVSDPDGFEYAVGALAALGVPAAELIPALDRVPRRDERTRLARVNALFAIAHHDEAALAALEAQLDDRSMKIVEAVFDRLVWLEPVRPEAGRRALQRASKHRSAAIRDGALARLRR